MKDKNTIFICQIIEKVLKVAKCVIHNNKREFTALEAMSIHGHIEEEIPERLPAVLKRLGYDGNPVIVSFPRSQVTCRFLNVPAYTPREIESLCSLQAARYLPYPTHELITGFQIISTDKEGYSQINLTIAHKNSVAPYIKIFKELKASKINVVLSSYGLSNLYGRIKGAGQKEAVMIIDVDSLQAELAIVSLHKLLFSRSFKLTRGRPDWENVLIEGINKSRDAYLKEVSQELPQRIFVVGQGSAVHEVEELLRQRLDLPIEILEKPLSIEPQNPRGNAEGFDYSFASLLGLGLLDTEESLNLLPAEDKEDAKNKAQQKKQLRIALSIAGIMLLWSMGMVKDLDNKRRYLAYLEGELNKISKEAKPLEEAEKKLHLFESLSQKKPTNLELLYELHRILPEQISLVHFSDEESSRVVVRGETTALDTVFTFVSLLEKSDVFKKFNIKVRYATQKKTRAGDIIDFEIICLKK